MMHQDSCACIWAASDVHLFDQVRPLHQMPASPREREDGKLWGGQLETNHSRAPKWPADILWFISQPHPRFSYHSAPPRSVGSPLLLLWLKTLCCCSRKYTMACLKTCVISKLEPGHCGVIPSYVSSYKLCPQRLAYKHHASASSAQHCEFVRVIYPAYPLFRRHSSWRALAAPVSLDEEPSTLPEGENFDGTSEIVSNDASEKLLPQKLNSDELKSLLADAERQKLTRKLSEANQYNRFLKRQLQREEDALVKFKSELAVLELELQALVGLAEEIANSGVQLGSRKINGKYIQSHLLARLGAVHEKVKEQIEDVDSLKFEEISLFWVGMAEGVQVMGSFDGWTRGEEMSPEYSGDYARFSTTLKLRPGRYEIKFLADGKWQLSPELPTVGEGVTKNNLLVVE